MNWSVSWHGLGGDWTTNKDTLWKTYKNLVKIAIEIVDLPRKNGDFPSFFVCLPEGTYINCFIAIC